jgi:sugar/nucleoside kinase (ribokinase family)
MTKTKSVIVAGHICLDIIPKLDNVPHGKFYDFFQPGLMIQIGPPLLATGGAVSNTGLALHILGIDTRLMGKIGQDMYGQVIRDLLERRSSKLVEGIIVDPSTSTSYTIIISPPGLDRIFLHHAGANETYCLEDLDFNTVRGISLFHFGYPPVMRKMYQNNGVELLEILRQTKDGGTTTSLDMCFPDPGSEGGKVNWRRIYKNILPFVDIFAPSIDELLFTMRRELYDELSNKAGSRFLQLITTELLDDVSNEVIEMGGKIVLLKLGERGAYLRTAGADRLRQMGAATPEHIHLWHSQKLWAPCFSVKVIGTTGSGDATIAGFLSSFLRNGTPFETINTAVAVGACNVEAEDAISGLRSWEETQKRISSGWHKQPLVIDRPGWEWDPHNNLWIGKL